MPFFKGESNHHGKMGTAQYIHNLFHTIKTRAYKNIINAVSNNSHTILQIHNHNTESIRIISVNLLVQKKCT